MRAELEELRGQDATLRETYREQLVSLQAGLAALTSTLDQHERARWEKSEQRLIELRELQGVLASRRSKTSTGVRPRPSSADNASGRSEPRHALRRPHSAKSSRDGVALAVGGRKSARTVVCATGAVKELGRNSLTAIELASGVTTRAHRSSSVHDRERPWRDGGDLTVRPSAADIVAASQVSDKRLKRFNRKMAAQSLLYKDVIARADLESDSRAAQLQHNGRLVEHRNIASVDKILSTTDKLLGLESEIAGKWRRSHRPKDGPVRLRPGGKSLMARSAKHAESMSTSAVVQPRRDTNPTDAARASQARSNSAAGLKVEIPEHDGSATTDIATTGVAHQESDSINANSDAKKERAARAEKMFKSLDGDNSGKLDRAELHALATALGTSLSDHEISEALAQVDKDGDGSVNLEEFLAWYESNLGTPSASPIHGGNGIQTSAKHSSGKRLFAKLESFSAQLSSVTNEDVKMPHNFIWVHLNATARIHTLKVDSSRLGPQLVDIAVLDKMHTEVLNSHSELHSKQATRTRLHGRSSSFAEGMSQADKAAKLVDQLLGHTAALLSEQLPASHSLRGHRRASSMKVDSDTQKASALLALAKQHNTTPSIKTTIWAGEASCLVRQGKPRAALKLLRRCSAALKSSGANNIERANGWLNESAAMSVAGDHAGALGCAEKAAAMLHEDLEKFEDSATVAGFFQRALITSAWLDTACLLCMSLYGASMAHLAQGQRAPAVAALQEAVAVASKWLGPERPVSRVLATVRDREVIETLATKQL